MVRSSTRVRSLLFMSGTVMHYLTFNLPSQCGSFTCQWADIHSSKAQKQKDAWRPWLYGWWLHNRRQNNVFRAGLNDV